MTIDSTLERIAVALEKLAGNAPHPQSQSDRAEQPAPKPRKNNKETSAPAQEPAPATAPKRNPFDEDETPSKPAAPVVTKAQVRQVLTDYANATDNEQGLAALAKFSSNNAAKMGDLLEADYAKVFEEVSKLLTAAKK